MATHPLSIVLHAPFSESRNETPRSRQKCSTSIDRCSDMRTRAPFTCQLNVVATHTFAPIGNVSETISYRISRARLHAPVAAECTLSTLKTIEKKSTANDRVTDWLSFNYTETTPSHTNENLIKQTTAIRRDRRAPMSLRWRPQFVFNYTNRCKFSDSLRPKNRFIFMFLIREACAVRRSMCEWRLLTSRYRIAFVLPHRHFRYIWTWAHTITCVCLCRFILNWKCKPHKDGDLFKNQTKCHFRNIRFILE